ncbi:hypothetical protein TorRG33x02_276070 [Trema orientale]|uniref:Uncharacterized protein n=1 Tax=Trema orientale TaxID=63057 RepID=A0A2P5CRB4_TREOI|nr:hypothetical protein TorRG33x02_276070 [Trema orientale]
MRMVQVSHAEKAATNILAPFMASNSITVEGSIVPRYQAISSDIFAAIEVFPDLKRNLHKDQIYKLVDERFGEKGELQALEPPEGSHQNKTFLASKARVMVVGSKREF